ncbi:uncharacterized mitochondrial protein AtMg00810-like [Helianthus annuus]|uniref:uncharacterized mitochondrial protein AtMg00810-like n=1 Tax=Helianthus annuus TaxID=4232 RepID=UPI000B903574|nr:uncharacterized mitochondrial protein AtMg00810-like [Helianthus annuus]
MTSPNINDTDVCGDCRLHGIIIIMEFKRLKIESMNVDCTEARLHGIIIIMEFKRLKIESMNVDCSNLKLIMEFKREMAKNFEMSDLGKLTYYLGIEVSQNKDGIKIKQEAYAKKILTEAGMINCNPTNVPIDPNVKVSKFEDEEDFDATRYRNIVGCLRCLLQTRPDLAFSVGVASRYTQCPKQSHAALIKQILRYLRGTFSYGITYTRGENMLVGYSDSSHNIDPDDGRSTMGHVTLLYTTHNIYLVILYSNRAHTYGWQDV